MSKNLISWRPSWFWRQSWIDNGYLISLYSIYANNHLYQFWYFYHKVNDRYTNCHILSFFIMQTGSSYLQIIPLILNHFWTNLVHLYKMYFWTSLVLCVVFKCQYFWSYSRKTHFWPFIYIFQRAVTHSKIVRLIRFFFLQVQDIPIKCFCSLSLITFKGSWAKMLKKLNCVLCRENLAQVSENQNWVIAL